MLSELAQVLVRHGAVATAGHASGAPRAVAISLSAPVLVAPEVRTSHAPVPPVAGAALVPLAEGETDYRSCSISLDSCQSSISTARLAASSSGGLVAPRLDISRGGSGKVRAAEGASVGPLALVGSQVTVVGRCVIDSL